jgi:hypothetical protein
VLLNHHFLLLQQLSPAIAATTVFLQWRHRTNKSIGERQTRDNKGNRGRKPEREKNKKNTQEGNKHGGQKSWENRKKKNRETERETQGAKYKRTKKREQNRGEAECREWNPSFSPEFQQGAREEASHRSASTRYAFLFPPAFILIHLLLCK